MQPAVLLELLCHLPMRVKNAASLDLKKHFQRTVGGKSGNWRVHIPKGEVKNDKAIDAELGITTSERISRYETVFRPALCDGQSTALFVSKKGQQKGPSAYGLYLGRLREQGHLDPDMRPVDRVDAPGVGAFVKEYSVGRAPHTVALAVRGIAYAIRATHPPDGLPWLTKIAHSMGNHAKPVKSKAPHMATIAELLKLGRELLTAGAQELASGHRQGAQIFRDELMICALATRPLRRRNFSALEIGRT
jgi:hypothetical protein